MGVYSFSRVSNIDYSWETRFSLPKMRVEGQYNMQGRILIIPLNGKGKCWMEPEKMDIVMYTKTKLYENEGFVFYNVTNLRIDYKIARLRLNFENLFDGIKALGERFFMHIFLMTYSTNTFALLIFRGQYKCIFK